MEDLKDMIHDMRQYAINQRQSIAEMRGVDVFFISMIEVSATLAELGIYQQRPITKEEEQNWFKGGYHFDFWDSNANNVLYLPFVKKIEEFNFFRD